jgi:hypothetical protein
VRRLSITILSLKLGAIACWGLVACSGERASGPGTNTPGVGNGAGGSGVSGGGAGMGSAGANGGNAAGGNAACAAADPVASPLRRLTRAEYDNTVRDLLGLDVWPSEKFPADEVAGGFSNNAAVLAVSPLLAEKYLEAAESLAAEAIKRLPSLLPCDPTAAGEEPCARQFAQRFGRRAYRRPLTDVETARLMRAYTAGRTEGTFAAGIELVIQTALQSPNFLYRFEFGMPARPGDKLVRLTQHEVATRLSYLLWGSMPDDRLAAAADAGRLGDAAAVATQAREMVADPRARRSAGEFYRQWLGLTTVDTVAKDAAVHPEFTTDLRTAMRAELQAFVEHVLWTGDRRLATLLTSPLGFPNAALARLYGVSAPTSVGQSVTLPAAERAGVLTQAGVLAVHALPNQSSPVARGKFVREQVLCQETAPPPPNLNVTPPEVDPTRTTRERFAEHTASPACSSCHALMDPIGFGFESYDAIGRYRTMDGDRPVDNAGWIASSQDVDGEFRGARQLVEKLAGSAQVRDCVATQWFRYGMGRFDGPGDGCSLQRLRQAFASSGGDLKEMLVAITQTDSFLLRPAPGPGEVSP